MSIYAQLDNTNTEVNEYPLSIYQIRFLVPGVSWPDEPTPEALIEYHFVIVTLTTPPKPISRKYMVIEGTPAKDTETNTWYQTWIQVRK